MAKKTTITLKGALRQLKVKDELLKRRNAEIKKLKELLRKSNEKRMPLIDQLQKAAINAGMDAELDSWTDNEFSVPPNDFCRWLDINIIDDEGTKWCVHFYFSNNATKLETLELFRTPLTPAHHDDDDTKKVF